MRFVCVCEIAFLSFLTRHESNSGDFAAIRARNILFSSLLESIKKERSRGRESERARNGVSIDENANRDAS